MTRLPRWLGRPLLLVVAVLACVSGSRGQDASGDEAPDAPSPRTVYVPYRELKGVFDNLGAGVIVPYSEWLKLRQQIERAAPPGAAVPAVITQAAYRAKVEKDLVRVTARLKVNVPGEPWVEIPMRFGDAAVGALSGPEGKVLLRGTGEGTYALLLGESGEHEITLELVSRVHTSPEGREFSFDVPPVAITTLEVTLPEADQTVEIIPQGAVQPREAAEGQTQIAANLGSTGRITARWHPRVSRRPEMELLTSVTNLMQVTVEDGLIRTDAFLTFDVLRGQVNQLRLEVPADERILDVSSPAQLKAWRAEAADNRQIIIVDLLSAADQQVPLEVHSERRLPEGEFRLAGRDEEGRTYGIHALDAAREAGQIAVRGAPDLELSLLGQQGLVRIDASQVDQRIRAEGAFAFKFYSPRFALTAVARPVEPRVLLQHASRVILREDEVRLEASLNYTIERAGVFQLVLAVPEDLVIDGVQCAAMREFSFDAATRLLTISLAERTTGVLGVQVTAHRSWNADAGESGLALPLLKPQHVTRETGTVRLFARETLEVATGDQQVSGAQPLPVPPGERDGDAVLAAAWSYTRRPVSIAVTIRRKAPRLTAGIATSVRVLPQSLEVRTQLRYDVQFSGIDTFQFQVPEAVASSVQIEAAAADATSPALKQKTASDPVDGWVTWTVVMQREVVGALPLQVTYDVQSPASDAEGGTAGAVTLDLIRALPAPGSGARPEVPLARIAGEVVVRPDPSLAVSAEVQGGDVEPIDVRELTLLPPEGTLAYRYFEQPADAPIRLTLNRSRYEIREVVATVVRRALVEIIHGEDGTALYRVRMRLKTSERQRLLFDLPAHLELLGVSVNGRDVRLEEAGPADDKVRLQPHYVPVARTTAADQEFLLTFNFRWKVAPHLGESEFLRGALELPLPVPGGLDAPSAVQELRVAVWVPRKFALVGEPPGFVIERQPRLFSTLTNIDAPVSDEQLDGWIGGGDSSLDPARKGRAGYVYSRVGGDRRVRIVWWDRVSMTILVSGAVALIALVLGRTGWENKLWMLLVAAFLLTLAALWDADWVAHAVSAARFGLAFLVGWWLITGLFAAGRSTTRARPVPAGAPTQPLAASAHAGIPPVVPPPGAIDELQNLAGGKGQRE